MQAANTTALVGRAFAAHTKSKHQQLWHVYVAKRAMYNANGMLGHNRVVLHHKYGLPDANGIDILFDVEWPADDLHRADLITELLSVREGVQRVEMTQADT